MLYILLLVYTRNVSLLCEGTGVVNRKKYFQIENTQVSMCFIIIKFTKQHYTGIKQF